jgi:hypothetical protein
MDEKLSKALEFANYTRTFEDQKYFDSMIHYQNGGQFTVDQSLITFVNLLLQKNTSSILIDDNDNPIDVNLQEFYDKITDLYFQSTNSYFSKLQEMKSKRSIEKLVEYE